MSKEMECIALPGGVRTQTPRTQPTTRERYCMQHSEDPHYGNMRFVAAGIFLALFLCLGVGTPDWHSVFRTASAEAAVKYVTQGGAGARDGSSWGNAFGEAELPAAIQGATAGDEFWIAKGAYRPSVTNDADATFELVEGVALYGGFSGTETASADRNWSANVTVLTGDLANDDVGKVNGVTLSAGQIRGINSKTVVTADSSITDSTVLDGLTVTAGRNTAGEGGGMVNTDGSPKITNCTFAGNTTLLAYGGGIFNDGGSPTITDCTFSGNSALYGGGMVTDGGSPKITDCTFEENTSTTLGGGMLSMNSTVTVAGCIFTGNSAFYGGGGMVNASSTVTATDCVFSQNSAPVADGGGMVNLSCTVVTVTDCTFSGNSAMSSGGGMINSDSTVTITGSVFSRNSASEMDGGGMVNMNGTVVTVTDCTFSGNTAMSGGGGMVNDSSDAVVTNCTFSGNTATDYGGAGMVNLSSNPIVTNCTFSGNSATTCDGGGMVNDSSDAVVTNCTFSGNTASEGAGMANTDSSPTIANCIFWNASAADEISETGSGSATVTHSVVRGGYVGTDIITIDPNLGPLAWHGGVTETMALPAGSSALDAGLGTGVHTIGGTTVTVLSADQRGVFRPQGAGVDIGTYEYWAGKAILAVETEGSGTVTRTSPGSAFGTQGNQWSYDTNTMVTLTAAATAPWSFAAWSGDVSGTNPVTTVTMNGDKRVTALFVRGWTITASAGPGGTIAPAGNVTVPEGTDQTFTVTPDAGYAVADVTVDGVSMGSATTYTFPNVTANHTIEAAFTAAPTATPTPPDPTATPSPTGGPTPSPFPSPDPSIPLPEITLTLTLVSGGTVIAGPVFITDPQALTRLFDAPSLLEALFDFAPEAVAAGMYNREASELFSILAQLDPGVTELTLLVDISMGGVSPGYSATVFLLVRTFDDQGNPTGFTLLPREEDASVFRRSATDETWRVAIADGGATDGAPEAGRVLPNLAAVVEVVRGEAPTGGGGGGGGCDTGAGGGNGFFGGALPVLLLLAVPLALLLQR